jgi:probable F420-dependent oxidoreductase
MESRRRTVSQSSIQLGPIGIWTRQLEDQPSARAQETASELEALGFGAIWFGEAVGREALTNAGLLLAGTKRIVIATGIANIYARDAIAMAAGQKTLAEAYPGRFLLGLGVSHVPLVEQMRGHRYEKPVATMRAYLDGMDQAPFRSVPPPTKPARVLAALGPKMLELSRERADGAHPYNVNPEHTAQAREILGADRYLCPEQTVVLETNPAKAREIGRAFLAFYLTLPNYANNFLRLGFQEADFKDGGSDRLIDAIVAWGDLNAIRNRIRAHQSAGADHVCIQVLPANPKELPLREWRELASALLHS